MDFYSLPSKSIFLNCFMILPILGKWITSTRSITAKKNSNNFNEKAMFAKFYSVIPWRVLLKRLHKITVHAIYILILSFYIYWPMTIFLLVCDHIAEGKCIMVYIPKWSLLPSNIYIYITKKSYSCALSRISSSQSRKV